MIDANERMSVDVLLTGANGRLGEAVAREFAHTAPTLRVAALGRSLLDAAEQEAVHEAFSRLAPRVVVNAAAFTDVAAAQAAARILPLSGQGFGWICPAVLGLILGLAVRAAKKRRLQHTDTV